MKPPVRPLSRSGNLADINAVTHGYCPIPSPQVWLPSCKRRGMPAFLDPPGFSLDFLLPVSAFSTFSQNVADQMRTKITRDLEDRQWSKRRSLLTHRYLRELGIARKEQIVENAWNTLEMFCVGVAAKKKLSGEDGYCPTTDKSSAGRLYC